MIARRPRRSPVALALVALLALCAATRASAQVPAAPRRVADPNQPISRIAFGSCAHQDRPQPVWGAVLAANPELFLLIGDNVYGDTLDMALLRRKYAQLAAVPGFARLRERCPLLATWDDHDYGENDAGVEYPRKAESQQVFLDFLGEPADSPRRTQQGVYAAQVFGPPGRRVQVILLDTRYFRTALKRRQPRVRGDGPYAPDPGPGGTVLGDAQWAWLAEQLRQPAELRVLASSIQVVSHEHGWEHWGNFPAERQRLFDLIRQTNAGGVVAISGDRHMAELSVERGPAVAYPLHDLTSSGLTETRPAGAEPGPNSRRVGDTVRENNFGLITVEWAGPDPRVTLEIRGVDGQVKIAEVVRLSELNARR